jgi:hypothetical protein
MLDISADRLDKGESKVRSTDLIAAKVRAGRPSSGRESPAMLGFNFSISKKIAAHRRRRRQALALVAALEARNGDWLITRSLGMTLLLVRWLERRAMRRLVNAVPRNGKQAQEKLRYTMAFLIADGNGIHSADIERIICTLRQFQFDTSAQLNRNISSKNE